jgi:iron(III) transport system permease protein
MKDAAIQPRQAWRQGLWRDGWLKAGLLVFALVSLGPLLALAAQASRTGDWLSLALPVGRRAGLLVHSVGLAAVVAAGGMALGILAATWLWRWRAGPRARLRWFLLALALVPPYVHAMAWSAAAAATNTLLESMGLPTIAFLGWLPSWWVQMMALAPIAVALALIGLESVEPASIEAARLAHPDVTTFTHVVLPLAAPAVAAGAGFLFVLSLADYSVPSLFGVNVYSLEILAEYSASSQPARAFGLALPSLLIAVGVIVASQAGLRNAAQTPAWRRPGWATAPDWPAWFRGLQWVAIAVLSLQIAVPLLSLAAAARTPALLAGSVAAASREIAFSFWVALTAALVCLPMALAAGAWLARPGRGGRLSWLWVTTPLAIPAPLIGIGLIAVWNQPVWQGVYGSAAMPVLAALARFAPFAAIILLTQLRRIDPLLVDAARVSQVHPLRTWLQVRLPMLLPGLLAAAGLVFALSMAELGATLLVAPPGRATLTMRIYNYLHYGASDTVAGLCLMMVAAVLAAGGLALAALAGWSRLLPDAGKE